MTPALNDIRAYYEARAPEYDDAFLGQVSSPESGAGLR